MALVSGRRSTLNPDAPLFIPAAVRQVEDFSPQWWDLVNSATWFRDYWLSQHQVEDAFEEGQHGFHEDNLVDLLPDSIDLDVDEDILDMEEQYEEFLQSYDTHNEIKTSAVATENGLGNNADAIVRSLNIPKQRCPNSPREMMKNWDKPAKHVSPKSIHRVIHQPR